ncbi:hypothetical protein D4A47_10185 [Anaerotruncus massiliensis (ex Liu et al. 2021)]|uniref:Uncharacterized protein n=2 Tax=Anaerotruncus TaxID=244127 RepID=A0A498CKK5_9FIRM|nr:MULTISPECIES: hypothetical protein [Anaerotruncus]MBC3939302.1 hypothetical protein [Anaerotruncus massiliensis (ex Togo et al. 2019)]RLL09609.1 hypothetical protein D4A47_10185 [Anaerotruncus massiliensis (ex Liu et al. 2021)]
MEIFIRIGYIVMIAAIVLCFYFSRKQQHGLREAVDRFAFAYVKISNHVSARPPAAELAVERGEGDAVRPLPLGEQPEAIRTVIERASGGKVVKLYDEMMDAMLEIENRCGRHRRMNSQFREPIAALFHKARTFLTASEHLENIRTAADKQAFDSFLRDQGDDRMVLLRRITGGAGEQFSALSKHYDLAAREAAEREKKRPARGR